ncbi:MAG: DUF3380 domain-containing protein [Deltaproteobacteria bacterium]|nr:DUF3380 domain-containing protein [Deltaproteobacteria bacterium]
MTKDNQSARGGAFKPDARGKPGSASKPASPARAQTPAAATDAAAGHRYLGAQALRSMRPEATPAALPAAPSQPLQTELHRQAAELRDQHGPSLQRGAGRLGVPESALAAIVLTERQYLARPSPTTADKMPVRFEPFVFFSQTGRWLVATHRDQAAEYASFDQARGHDDLAAHRALRMGVGQVSGQEAEIAGFPSPQAMHDALQAGPAAQVDALVGLVQGHDDLRAALANSDWTQAALLRAGPGYGALGYDHTLQVAAQAYRSVKPGGGDDDDDKKKKPKKP